MTIASQGLDKPLQGQRVVVVGGTSGMGLGAVKAITTAGAEIVVAGRRPITERNLDQYDPDRTKHVFVDITDEDAVHHLFDEIGQLDHLFVTAAPPPGSWGSFLEQDVRSAKQYFDKKLFGSWACARYAAPNMSPCGSITFLTGVAAVSPSAGLTTVTTTFAALEALSRSLALDLAPLRVNTIRPGLVDSEMWNFLDDSAREHLRQTTAKTFPVQRIGNPADIGSAALFLMTNSYVTGITLEVSGGESLVKLEM